MKKKKKFKGHNCTFTSLQILLQTYSEKSILHIEFLSDKCEKPNLFISTFYLSMEKLKHTSCRLRPAPACFISLLNNKHEVVGLTKPQNRGCMEITTMRLNAKSGHVRETKTRDILPEENKNSIPYPLRIKPLDQKASVLLRKGSWSFWTSGWEA